MILAVSIFIAVISTAFVVDCWIMGRSPKREAAYLRDSANGRWRWFRVHCHLSRSVPSKDISSLIQYNRHLASLSPTAEYEMRKIGQPDHSPLLLDMTALEGDGQATHPDVVAAPVSWGRERHWLMSITSFPFSNDHYENPELLTSRDGFFWTLTARPVDAPDSWLGYNSDPSLLVDKDQVILFYRRVKCGAKFRADISLFRTDSGDGCNWSKPRLIMQKSGNRKDCAFLMSPSVLKQNGHFVMWYAEQKDGIGTIYRTESRDGLNWEDPLSSHISGGHVNPWHLDVVPYGGLLLMALTSSEAGALSLSALTSADNGFNWIFHGPLLKTGYSFEKQGIYRASIVPEGDSLLVYYSGCGQERMWRTAVTRVSASAFGIEMKQH